MDTLLQRFLRYVQIDTQSDETSDTYPSTAKQLDLSRLLAAECMSLGLADVCCDEFGIVTATIPSSVDHAAPAFALFAHVDTSPEYSSTNVNPVVHENYQGGDIVLPNAEEKVIRVANNPALKSLVGATIITTDGTTLLGSDDKSGIAVIMSVAAHLMAHPDVPHGPIRVCFTCDEEIGHGVDKIDLKQLNAVCGYTLDGDGVGKIDSETFSADGVIVTVKGINTHPSIGKDAMVNSIRILSQFITRLPTDTDSPETTDGREGFIHPYHVEGGVAEASARILLRDFETEQLGEYATLLRQIAADLESEHPLANINVEVRQQYRNMRDGLAKEPRALEKAIEATRAAGIEPTMSIIRGGTDGSQLSEMGLPTPNLSTGEHNPHSPLEWTSVEEMQQAVDVLVQLAIAWGRELE
ncbi:MAG: peptidase T [Planctomycetaceae bacterium]|jgi:tripeptide aminopeptidase|nr:peptidase T [Planctomycetaceae bacterium]MBT6487744.1 peptidase T [Planctomycetaceae bacterium]MBT6493541.1 peptidase T [Planctomycetaceae bacterium]